MAILRGLNFEHQSAVANRPHKVGYATTRVAANDTLFEVLNGDVDVTTNRKFVVDLDGKIYSAALTVGGLLYGVTGGVSSVQRADVLAIGTAYQQLRVNAGGTAPEWGSGRLTTNTTPVSTAGTGEDNLMTYAVPAGLLGVNGQALRITAWGTVDTTPAGRQILKFYFGATGVTFYKSNQGNSLPDSFLGAWGLTAYVARTGAATQLLHAVGSVNQGANMGDNNAIDGGTWIIAGAANASPVETLSGSITLKCTGEAINAADTITQAGLVVEFLG